MNMENIDQYIKNGAVLTEIYFDFHSLDEEKLKNLATGFVNDLISDLLNKGYIIFGVGEIEPVEKNGEYFSTYTKLTILFKDVYKLILTVGEYNPIGIEILRPDQINIDVGNFQECLLDLSKMIYQAKLDMMSDQARMKLKDVLKYREEKGKLIRKNVQDRNKGI